MMRRVVLFACFLLVGASSWAQEFEAQAMDDALYAAQPTGTEVIEGRLAEYEALAMVGDISQAMQLAQQVLSPLSSTENSRIYSYAYRRWAQVLMAVQEYEEAESHMISAIESAKARGDSAEMQELYTQLANIYKLKGEYRNALVYYQRAAKLSIELENLGAWLVATQGQNQVWEKLGITDSAMVQMKKLISVRRAQANREVLSYYAALADWYKNEGDGDQALTYWQQGLLGAEQVRDTLWMIDFQSNLARLHRERGQYTTAMELYLTCLKWSQEIQNLSHLANSYNRIGVLYYEQQGYKQAIANYKQARAVFARLGDPRGEARTINNIGFSYLEAGELDSAQLYLEASIQRCKSLNYERLLGWSYNGLARVWVAKDDPNEALTLAHKSVGYRNGESRLVAQSYLTLAEAHRMKNAVDSAGYFYQEALTLAKEAKDADYHYEALEGVSWYYDRTNKPRQALGYYRQYKAMGDSLRNDENTRMLALMAAENAFAAERDSLAQAQKMERVALTAEIQQRQLTQLITGAGLVMALVLIWVVGRGYRQKKQALETMARLKDEIQSQKDNLDQLVETKDRFFSIISHDLRGPIHSFSSLTFLLKDQVEKGELDELPPLMDALEKNSKGVSQLLDNLLNWALQQQGLLTYQPTGLLVRQAVDDTFAIFEYQAQSKEIKLVDEVPDDLLVHADTNTFMTILRNLVSNALKFTRTGGQVMVHAYAMDDLVRIEIKDDGIGMTADQVAMVFAVDGKKVGRGTAGEKGTGLGLPLVKDFVEANEGTLRVESTEGEGTVFHITLPKGKE